MAVISDEKTKSGLSIKLGNLQPRPGLSYDQAGEKGESVSSPPPNQDVGPTEKKRLLLAFCKSADGPAIDEAFALLEGKALLKAPEPGDGSLPLTAPALWEERTTGRKVSPADFVRTYYAPWIGNGLTRAHIGQLDRPLYMAYARQVSRTPASAITELPSEERLKRDDPVEALERIRAQTRASVSRLRNAM
jgi:hypothetical protein